MGALTKRLKSRLARSRKVRNSLHKQRLHRITFNTHQNTGLTTCVSGGSGFAYFFAFSDNGNGNRFRREEMRVCTGDDGCGIVEAATIEFADRFVELQIEVAQALSGCF